MSMTPDDFINQYEAALASQDWTQVDSLVHQEACVTFSSGAVHKGKDAVRQAFEHNFSLIQEEMYRMENVHWAHKGEETAVYLFTFHWSGLINGKPASGAGTGSSVIKKSGEKWQLLVEHLGPEGS